MVVNHHVGPGNQGSLQEQAVLLTTVPPLQHPPKPFLNINFFIVLPAIPRKAQEWAVAVCSLWYPHGNT